MTTVELRVDSYELAGRTDAPVVAVLGGISATCRPRDWWPGVVHAGGDIDLDRFGVLGVEYLDGGETPAGLPERDVTTHEQADALADTLDALELERIHTLV